VRPLCLNPLGTKEATDLTSASGIRTKETPLEKGGNPLSMGGKNKKEILNLFRHVRAHREAR